jgi:hypothetical protein
VPTAIVLRAHGGPAELRPETAEVGPPGPHGIPLRGAAPGATVMGTAGSDARPADAMATAVLAPEPGDA